MVERPGWSAIAWLVGESGRRDVQSDGARVAGALARRTAGAPSAYRMSCELLSCALLSCALLSCELRGDAEGRAGMDGCVEE